MLVIQSAHELAGMAAFGCHSSTSAAVLIHRQRDKPMERQPEGQILDMTREAPPIMEEEDAGERPGLLRPGLKALDVGPFGAFRASIGIDGDIQRIRHAAPSGKPHVGRANILPLEFGRCGIHAGSLFLHAAGINIDERHRPAAADDLWKFSIPFLDRAELQDDGADGLLLDALGFGLSSSRHDLLLAFDPDPLKIPLRLECQLLCRLFRFNGFVEAFGKLKVGNVQLIEENETVDQTGLHGGLDLVLHHLPLRKIGRLLFVAAKSNSCEKRAYKRRLTPS